MKKLLLASILLVGIAVVLGAASMRRVEGAFFESDGVRIHYTDEGNGEPVVLIHGLVLNIDLQWRLPGMIEALSPDYRVIAIDQRGHGLSDKPHQPARYGMTQVDDVIRLLDHLGIERAHLVGYSLGGLVTRRTALSHPERVISAVSAAAGWIRPEANPFTDSDAIATALADDDFSLLIAGLGNTEGPPTPPVLGKVIAFGMASINDGAAIAAAFRAAEDMAAEEGEMRSNQVPTLTLMGAIDPLSEGVEEIDLVTPNHETRIIDGYGHGLYPRSPEFESIVKRFLDAHREG